MSIGLVAIREAGLLGRFDWWTEFYVPSKLFSDAPAFDAFKERAKEVVEADSGGVDSVDVYTFGPDYLFRVWRRNQLWGEGPPIQGLGVVVALGRRSS